MFSSADGRMWFRLKIATSLKIVICFALGLKFNILHIGSLKKSSELLWKICNENLSSLREWDRKMAQSENSSEKSSQPGKKYIISGWHFNRIFSFFQTLVKSNLKCHKSSLYWLIFDFYISHYLRLVEKKKSGSARSRLLR